MKHLMLPQSQPPHPVQENITSPPLQTSEKLANIIYSSNGKILNILFQKKDQTLRSINCRLGVSKGVKGIGLSFDPKEKGLFTVFDLKKNGFRFINKDKVIEVKTRGKSYLNSDYIKLFVYGTLKKGRGNDYYLRNCALLGDYTTTEEKRLNKEGKYIWSDNGELYLVPISEIGAMDSFENRCGFWRDRLSDGVNVYWHQSY